jgi:tetratricopeptide (TPR) repeat protein
LQRNPIFAKIHAMTPNIIYRIVLLIAFSVILISLHTHAQEPTAKTFFDIGMQNNENAEYSEAIDAFKRAIELKSDYANAYYNLGHAYFNLHRYDEAHDAYKKAVKINPKFGDAYFSLGIR